MTFCNQPSYKKLFFVFFYFHLLVFRATSILLFQLGQFRFASLFLPPILPDITYRFHSSIAQNSSFTNHLLQYTGTLCPRTVTGFCRCSAFRIGKICDHNCIIRNFQFRKFLPAKNNFLSHPRPAAFYLVISPRYCYNWIQYKDTQKE